MGDEAISGGALCFLIGSLCYWAAPFLDFWELTNNYGNLLEPPPDVNIALQTHDTYRMAALYEHLYKSHILRIQMANCLVYMLGGGFFVAGSTLFFPAMAAIIYHGGWLYITGCVLTLSGALLAMLTAFEMRRTALPIRFAKPPSRLLLPSWSDEGATIASCSLYITGNVMYIIGSVCFFPRVIEIGGWLIELSAVLLFVGGSIVFTLGAIIDLIVVARAPFLARAPSAPQARGLTMPRWPTRPPPSTPKGAFANVAKGATCKVGVAPAQANRKYERMGSERGEASLSPSPRGIELTSCSAIGRGDSVSTDAPPPGPASPMPASPQQLPTAEEAMALEVQSQPTAADARGSDEQQQVSSANGDAGERV